MKHCLVQKKCFIILALAWLTIFIAINYLHAQTVNSVNNTWSLAPCIVYAKQNNPQVANSRSNEQTITQNWQLLKAAKYPDRIASATQILTNNNTSIYTAGAPIGNFSGMASGYSSNLFKDYGQQIKKNLSERIGLTISSLLLNKRIVKTDIAQSQNAIEKTDVDLRNRKTVLSHQVEQAYTNSLNAHTQLEAAQKQFTANRKLYRISPEELPIRTFAVTNFLPQKSQYIQVKYNALTNAQVCHFFNDDPIKL